MELVNDEEDVDVAVVTNANTNQDGKNNEAKGRIRVNSEMDVPSDEDDDQDEKVNTNNTNNTTSTTTTGYTSQIIDSEIKTQTTQDMIDDLNAAKQLKYQKNHKISRDNSDAMALEMQDTLSKKQINDTASFRKYLMYSFSIVFRSLSVLDLVTDIYLLAKAGSNVTNSRVLIITVLLFVSIISPYILSYSSGIKLFLIRRTFDELQGFYRILIVLYLFPTGVFYFVFLDILDILLNIYRWLLLIVFGWNLLEITKLEETLAAQLGMDKMNYEGFKRQRTVAQIMFETFPQVIIQILMFSKVIDITTIQPLDLGISIFSATVNAIAQLSKIYLESHAVGSTFTQVCFCWKLVLIWNEC